MYLSAIYSSVGKVSLRYRGVRGSNPDFFVLFVLFCCCCLFVCLFVFVFLFFMLLVTVVLIGDFTAKILSLFINSVTFERKMTVVILCLALFV